MKRLWPRLTAARSMRARMTLWLACIVAVVMSAAATLSVLNTRHEIERHFSASLTDATGKVANTISKGATLDDIDNVLAAHNDQVAMNGGPPAGVSAWLVDGSGRTVWQSRLRPPPPRGPPPGPFGGLFRPRPPRPPRGPHPHGGPPPPRGPYGNNFRDWRVRQIDWNGQRLLLTMPWGRTENELQRQAVALFGLVLLSTLVTACGAWFLVGKTLAPIDALAAQAGSAAGRGGDGAMPRLQATSPDAEVVRLVDTFNAMLDSLHESALSKERFHASASHELRTPLAGLAGLLSLTLSRERTSQEYQDALHEAETQTKRLTVLTHDLLLLNRLQTAASAPPRETVEVADILDLALQRAESTIRARSLKLTESLTPLDIEATPSHVEILLGNLLENAAKYAREGGEMRVAIEARTRSVLIENDCDQATLQALQGQWERLFEPFFRPDASRHSQTGGNGLGLAICHAICEANGWQMKIGPAAGGSVVRAVVWFKA